MPDPTPLTPEEVADLVFQMNSVDCNGNPIRLDREDRHVRRYIATIEAKTGMIRDLRARIAELESKLARVREVRDRCEQQGQKIGGYPEATAHYLAHGDIATQLDGALGDPDA